MRRTESENPLTPQQLEQCVETNQHQVRSFLAGLGVAGDVIDDLAQEVFVDYFYDHAKRPADVVELAWLKGMARNKARNWFRTQSRRSQLLERFAAHLEQTTSSFETGHDDDEVMDQLVRCMDDLNGDERSLMERYYNGGEAAKSIAAAIGSSAAAIRVRLMRLRERLRQCLQVHGHGR